jgi:hypothetical protein
MLCNRRQLLFRNFGGRFQHELMQSACSIFSLVRPARFWRYQKQREMMPIDLGLEIIFYLVRLFHFRHLVKGFSEAPKRRNPY